MQQQLKQPNRTYCASVVTSSFGAHGRAETNGIYEEKVFVVYR